MPSHPRVSAPQLVIALDLPNLEENLALARIIYDNPKRENIWLKVGLRAFIRDGAKGIEKIKKTSGAKIFLDLKLYDIPNTMADAAKECAHLGIDMMTIHASAGLEGMRAVMQSIATNAPNMKVMAVSALTSFDDESFYAVYGKKVDSGVRDLSALASQAGVSGMVCSVLESRAIKATHSNLLTLTPGIRPQSQAKPDDQKRTATIAQAVQAQADFLVIGRPIYTAQDPQAAIESALMQIDSAYTAQGL